MSPRWLWTLNNCCCGGANWSYAWGGRTSSGFSVDNDAYNSIPDSWTAKTDLPSPARCLFAAATVGGFGFCLVGEAGPPTFRIADNDRYDPNADAWDSRANVPEPKRNQVAVSEAGEKIYLFAGADLTSTVPVVVSDHQDCDEYDPSADAWAARLDMPAPGRRGPAAAAIDGLIYSWGGLHAPDVTIQDNDQYDPLADAWTSKTDIPLPARDAAGGASIGGKGYLVLGRGASNSGLDGPTDEYDPLADSWTNKQNTAGLWWAGCTEDGDVIRCFGGLNEDNATPTVANLCYSPAVDAWSVQNELPAPARSQLTAGAP